MCESLDLFLTQLFSVDFCRLGGDGIQKTKALAAKLPSKISGTTVEVSENCTGFPFVASSLMQYF
jgi:hypothetical protein